MNTREYEFFALSLLEKVIADFPKMEKGESPDFYSDVMGLEITRSISSSDGEYDAMIKKCLGKPYSAIQKNLLLKLGFDQEPVALKNSILFCHRSHNYGALYYFIDKSINELRLLFAIGKVLHRMEYDDTIAKSVRVKLDKLNTNYTIKEKNTLLLIIEKQLNYLLPKDDLDEMITEEYRNCVNTIKNVYAETQDLKIHFDEIIILFLDHLFIIDTKTWSQNTIKIDQNQLKAAIDSVIGL